jgi:HPt (histidine-containing phosphotransfer) domain-containing protein
MRASHVIKGASSNLMCQELRETSTNLEQSAAVGNDIPRDDGASDELEKATEDVKEKYSDLKKAVDNYHEFLESVDI